MSKSEILFYYESRQNPNGDPDAGNQPRLMQDETIMVTDVRIKRTIRDFAKKHYGYILFVDYGKNDIPVTADARAKEIAGATKNYIKDLLTKTFDVPLFGGFIALRRSKDDESGSAKITGPVQFGMGRSVNKVNLVQPSITSRFVGKETEGAKMQHATIGRFHSVEYALLKIQGAINPANLENYLKNKSILAKFEKYSSELPMILWHGTNQLITRSKYPQRSILYIQVVYKDAIYNDLVSLVDENEVLKGRATELGTDPFLFDRMVEVMNKRKSHIEKIMIKSAEDVDISNLTSRLDGIKVEIL